jgi:plasmid rolling circle replication initiator protein Rep
MDRCRHFPSFCYSVFCYSSLLVASAALEPICNNKLQAQYEPYEVVRCGPMFSVLGLMRRLTAHIDDQGHNQPLPFSTCIHRTLPS